MKRFPIAACALAGVALLCYLVLFGTVHDVWHFYGRPDISQRSGPPYADLRAFAVALDVLFPVLVAQFALALVELRTRGR